MKCIKTIRKFIYFKLKIRSLELENKLIAKEMNDLYLLLRRIKAELKLERLDKPPF